MIHTFWHNTDTNKKLPFNNVNCIKSWIHQGKEINIWVYDDNILTSEFKTFCNNNELISINDADQIIPYDEYTTIDYGSNGHSFASFSDVFRYKVLDIFGGWWLDTDIILLNRNLDVLENDLDDDSEPLFFIERYSTHQDHLKLNNAVIYAPKKGIMDSFYKESLSILNDMIENKRLVVFGVILGQTLLRIEKMMLIMVIIGISI
ncbi:hypothetical protein HYO65_gp257 [Tenacibaculum phage PTm1]|uniref:Glycosyltransferase n=1 Tax=Tenacibaculum phage PTm1 TaxID=2547425 RepID=A0A5S9BZ72_9CAUD|nr:hypothetical protein HYO65_gp257 [Tenacibaculum phage PTm1]BBI90649.1 hypothetical protein [Tenacibaculum phage PTm1]